MPLDNKLENFEKNYLLLAVTLMLVRVCHTPYLWFIPGEIRRVSVTKRKTRAVNNSISCF